MRPLCGTKSFEALFCLFLYACFAEVTVAVKLEFVARRSSAVGGASGGEIVRRQDVPDVSGEIGDEVTRLGNVGDMRYTTNITINGVDVRVFLDTGSTDLWVGPPGGLGRFRDTGIPIDLRYGSGQHGVSGTIGIAPVTFGDYSVEQQAFLDVKEFVNMESSGVLEHGIYGLMGLSFQHGGASPINDAVLETSGPTATWGHSFLHNVFEQDPDQPNFIAIDLARTADLEDTAGGTLGIGEYDERYAAIADAPKLPQFPVGGTRWTMLLEGLKVDGVEVEMWSSIRGAPRGAMVAFMDTGAPISTLPVEQFDAVFGNIPGAVWDEESGHWFVPCNTTASVVFTFGGQDFPIHPLDITEVITFEANGRAYSTCRSAFRGQDGIGGDEFEVFLGADFLRNVYVIHDFGDYLPDGGLGEPYTQLLSQVDPERAAAQSLEVRAISMRSLPRELDPSSVVQLFLSGEASTESIARPLLSQAEHQVTATTSQSAKTDRGAANGGLDKSINLADYGKAVIALLSVNILIMFGVVVVGVLNYVRLPTPKTRRAENGKGYQYVA